MAFFKKIDFLFSRLLLIVRKHLDYMQGYLFSEHIAKVTGAKNNTVHFNYPYYVCGEKYMHFKGDFSAFPGTRIECIDEYHGQKYNPKLCFGKHVVIHYYCHIGVINEVTIGDHVLLGSHVLITDHQHGQFNEEDKNIPWAKRSLFSKGPVHIEDNVWLGENVCVMPAVTIGKGSVIGANSVVTHDIPPYSLAAGVPAKIIRNLKERGRTIVSNNQK